MFTRGILIDVPRLKGVPYLEPGTPTYVEAQVKRFSKNHVRGVYRDGFGELFRMLSFCLKS